MQNPTQEPVKAWVGFCRFWGYSCMHVQRSERRVEYELYDSPPCSTLVLLYRQTLQHWVRVGMEGCTSAQRTVSPARCSSDRDVFRTGRPHAQARTVLVRSTRRCVGPQCAILEAHRDLVCTPILEFSPSSFLAVFEAILSPCSCAIEWFWLTKRRKEQTKNMQEQNSANPLSGWSGELDPCFCQLQVFLSRFRMRSFLSCG